jgi:hypothetical protein
MRTGGRRERGGHCCQPGTNQTRTTFSNPQTQFLGTQISSVRETATDPAQHPFVMKLEAAAVRRRASSVSGCIEMNGNNNNVCSFLLEESAARVTVFCDTGTVAIGRVLNGTVRHTFRKNVSSLDVLERILQEPDAPVQIDWNLVGSNDDGQGATKETYESVSKNLELIDVGMAILRGEREKLCTYVDVIADNYPSPIESASTSLSKDRTKSSMEFQFSLPKEPMKHVDQCLSDIHKMGKLVHGVSTNGLGTVFLYGNGGVAYTPNIPRQLYHRLSQLRNSKSHSGRPSYISLGTRDRFFMTFYDGTFCYKGPKALDRELRKISKAPKSVSFGQTYDAFFIVFHDGTWKYQGRGIPPDLEAKLKSVGPNLKLSCVNLGPNNEWFLRSAERVGWGGGSEELEDAIKELMDAGHYVNFLDFGENGSYFVSYD